MDAIVDDGAVDAAWFSAWTSAGALAFGAVAAVAALRVLRIEATRDKEAADDKRKEQAARVAAWFGLRPQDQRLWGVFLRNASDVPVYNVVVDYYLPDDGGSLAKLEVDENPMTLPPAAEPMFIGLSPQIDTAAVLTRGGVAEMVVGLRFRDSAGQEWRRGPSGHLAAGPRRLVW